MHRYFHGTSSANLSSIRSCGLIGGINLTEERGRNTDVVFLTTSYQSALGYAGRSKAQRGGKAVVLVILSSSARPWKNKKGCTIFTAPNVSVEEICEIIEP
jgi:hypothetical protein